MFFIISLSFYDVSALKSTSSELTGRSVCEKIELALANSDGTITSVGCYSSYNDAKSAMNAHESDDAIILEKVSGKFRVIDAKYALIYLDRGDINTNIYTTSALKTAYTYMNNYASYGGTEAAFIGVNYANKAIKIKISGVVGWIPSNTYTIIPLNWVKSSGYYYNNDSSILHYYAKNIENNNYVQMSRALGPKLDYLTEKTKYYSYDGNYFYGTLKQMLADYKNNTYENSVNFENPYYNYYLYLPHRTKTTYSVDDLDVYLRNVLNFQGSNYAKMKISNYSVLYGQSDFYLNAEKIYGANALSVFSLSRNESANGTSSIAINKNNIFGHNAVDGSAYNSATGYLDVRSSIYNHAYGFVNYGYSEVADSRYYGGHFGNKNMGMNVKYASDPYWGEKAANYYYLFDKDNGMSDYNYYQLGITTNSGAMNVRSEPNTTSAIPFVFKYANTPVVILDEVEGTEVNGSKIWYKIQADSNLNSTNTKVVSASSSWPEYNWNSVVYIHSSCAKKINEAKNEDGTYNQPADVSKTTTNDYTYKTYATNTAYDPIVGLLKEDVDYYYSSSLINKKGTALKGSYVVILEEAKNGEDVRYLVVTDYTKNQKAWISGENVEIVDRDLLVYLSTTSGACLNIRETPGGADIGDFCANTHLPILDKEELSIGSQTFDGTWVKVQFSVNPISYGYVKIIDNMSYSFDNLNKEPVITASDKTFYIGDEYDLLEGVLASDNEDGNLTDKIKIIENNVNDTKAGTYTVTYSVTDSFGITVTKSINVTFLEYKEGDPLFMYHNLEHKEGNVFEISGFLGIKGMDNKEVEHAIYLYNQVSEEYYVETLDNWQEYPYEMSSLDDKKVYDYSGGWFKSELDFTDIPSGDYIILIEAINGDYETASVFTNIAYANMTRRATNKTRGYAIEIDYTSTGSPLIFSIRDNGLLSNDIPNTIDPMYNFFTEFALAEHELTLKGTSHSVGVDFGIDKEVKRELIFENIKTYERVAFDLGSITNGDYSITLAVSDNCDKTKAWYEKTINLESLPVGEYVLYIKNTVDGKSYYGELIDIAYTNFADFNNSRYNFRRVNERRLRVELVVNE